MVGRMIMLHWDIKITTDKFNQLKILEYEHYSLIEEPQITM